jgi:type I restriction enzyme R subunit
MWLTGFDVPNLSTLYLDKPMKSHTLMQAIARANRVYPKKPCGIIVDYVNVFKYMKKALSDYAVPDDDDHFET